MKTTIIVTCSKIAIVIMSLMVIIIISQTSPWFNKYPHCRPQSPQTQPSKLKTKVYVDGLHNYMRTG